MQVLLKLPQLSPVVESHEGPEHTFDGSEDSRGDWQKPFCPNDIRSGEVARGRRLRPGQYVQEVPETYIEVMRLGSHLAQVLLEVLHELLHEVPPVDTKVESGLMVVMFETILILDVWGDHGVQCESVFMQ